jgi:hypothetical protein
MIGLRVRVQNQQTNQATTVLRNCCDVANPHHHDFKNLKPGIHIKNNQKFGPYVRVKRLLLEFYDIQVHTQSFRMQEYTKKLRFITIQSFHN